MSSPHRQPAYRLVSRASHPEYAGGGTRRVRVGDVTFGEGAVKVAAGPCAVESREQTLAAARAAKAAGADLLRGGAYKTRTSPYDFQGLGEAALEILAEARAETGLPVVTEVIDPRHVERVAAVADMLQVGTRNMHNTPLLTEAGASGKPVLLKRGWASTLREWLCAAEYVAAAGRGDVVLCERGIRLDPRAAHASPTLDYEAIRLLRGETALPVLLDPSHGTEDASRVALACELGVAAGVDGLLIEVLPPGWPADRIRCDAHQSVTPEVLSAIVKKVKGPES